MAQTPAGGLVLMVHTQGRPLDLSAPVRDAVRALDPNLPLFDIAVLWDGIQQNAWGFRVFGSLFAVFGVAALFLATVGLYGVMSYSRHTCPASFGSVAELCETRAVCFRG